MGKRELDIKKLGEEIDFDAVDTGPEYMDSLDVEELAKFVEIMGKMPLHDPSHLSQEQLAFLGQVRNYDQDLIEDLREIQELKENLENLEVAVQTKFEKYYNVRSAAADYLAHYHDDLVCADDADREQLVDSLRGMIQLAMNLE